MSLIRAITRIYPLNAVPEGLSKLLSPKEFGNPSKVQTNCFTDPRNGLQYVVETALLVEKLERSDNIDERISLECEKFPGLVFAPENSLLLSPENGRDVSKDYAALCVPKSIHWDEVFNVVEKNSNVDCSEPENALLLSSDESTEVNSNASPTSGRTHEDDRFHSVNKESEKCPSLKIRLNLKKIQKDCADRHALKKARGKLLQPLFRYFIENECLICGFVTSKLSKHSIIKHLSSHIDGRSYKCECGSLFSSAKIFYLHAIKHAKLKPYSCDTCKKMYHRKHSVTVHQLKDHSISSISRKSDLSLKQKFSSVFICTVCNIRLQSVDSVVAHKKNHAGEENYQCLFCGKLFSNTCLIHYHLHLRIVNQTYGCRTCGKHLPSYEKLQNHRKLHVKKVYLCNVCGKKFYFQSNFLKHVRLLHEAH
ncbi:Zinc finger and SCAN domain-containing protein 2 [Araneus ventricosus]|uniref:Zinc finger and SCAN domain-containing protein 2 n=1 Tax=Araneus ventricosus TaxID=182803 RepID=A0A4Y2EGF4_ARAVE|nr:Zinc finger and SCAN domain-containing protein 2 [Araneus ventricosus]